jgi:DNA-directed RNA polymerase subunit RPC12/RpoP
MAIRFACAQCGKIHQIPDHDAGKPGRCGRCGVRFVVPGTTPSTSNVFVPYDSDSDSFQLQDRNPTRNDRSGVLKTVGLGLIIGLILIGCMFLLRDGIAYQLPGLAPLLPPKAAPKPGFAAQQPRLGTWFDAETAAFLAVILLGIAHFLVLVVVPLTLPAIISRTRILSVGRWLILSAVCAFFTLLWVGFITMVDPNPIPPLTPAVRSLRMILTVVAGYGWCLSFFGIPGCLIAAALHPKYAPPAG